MSASAALHIPAPSEEVVKIFHHVAALSFSCSRRAFLTFIPFELRFFFFAITPNNVIHHPIKAQSGFSLLIPTDAKKEK